MNAVLFILFFFHKIPIFYFGYWDPADTSHANDVKPLANIVNITADTANTMTSYHSRETTHTLNVEEVEVAVRIQFD